MTFNTYGQQEYSDRVRHANEISSLEVTIECLEEALKHYTGLCESQTTLIHQLLQKREGDNAVEKSD